MSVLLLVLWAGGLIALPGRLLARILLAADAKRGSVETWSFSFAFGLGWLTTLSVVLRFADALRLSSVVGATLALVVGLLYRARKIERLPGAGSFFWIPSLLTLSGLAVALLPRIGNAFGADTYFWTEAAARLTAGGLVEGRPFWELYPLFTESPTGYGYLLATAALVTPELHAGAVIAFFGILWTGFAFASAFALGEHLAGRAWAAFGALLYLGSYWTLYFLVTSVSRQALGFGLAPLFFLLLARRGADVVRDLSLYALLGTCFLLHAFTAFFLLASLPAVFVVDTIREGWTRRRAAWGLFGCAAAVALSAAPLWVLGRFLGDLTGLVPLSDAPFKYRLQSPDPLELVKSVGGLTLAALAAGPLLLLPPRREIALLASSMAVFAVTVLVGLFPQSWYQASYMALPAHRFYVFYSLVALVWIGLAAPRIEKRLPAKSGTGAILLALAQLSFSAFFALRMIEPRPRLQTVLDASRWVAARSSPDDGVALVLSRLDGGVTVARGVLAPRRIVTLESGEEAALELARRSSARYLITDVDLAGSEGLSETARFDLEPETVRVFRIEP